jgi:hypothetical protein
MSALTWDELAEQAWQLEEAGQFAESLALITPYRELFPTRWLYYHAQLRCAAHISVEQALDVFRAALADGYWFDENSLAHEPTLSPLLAREEFAPLLAVSKERRSQAQAAATPMLLTIHPPAFQPPYPCFSCLARRRVFDCRFRGALASSGTTRMVGRHSPILPGGRCRRLYLERPRPCA